MKVLTAAFAGLMMLSGATAASAQQIQINIGHVLSEASSYQAGAKRFGEILAERTGGRVKVNLFPAGSLGGEIRLIQGARTGTVDAMVVGQPSIENTVTEYKVLSLPYLFDDTKQAYRILQGDVGKGLLDVLSKYNMVGLGWGGVFERNFASMKPIESMDSMKGLKVRVIQSPGYVQAYEALGSQPTPTAYAELFLALQNGVVDACELGPDQTVSDGFADVIRYYSHTRVHFLPSALIMSKVKFNALPKDIQPIVIEAGREAMLYAAEFHEKAVVAGIDAMKERKITFSEPPLEPFRAAAQKSWDRVIGDVPDGKSILADIENAKKQ